MPEKTILYAEDDENDVFFMRRAFKSLQRREALHMVANGDRAIAYLEEIDRACSTGAPLSLCLVFLDGKLPGRSGLEVLQWIRQHARFSDLPVVMLTSSTQRKDIDYASLHGANAYLVKPSNAERLPHLLEEVLALCAADIVPLGRFDIPGNILANSCVTRPRVQ